MRLLRKVEGYGDSASRWAHHLNLTDTQVSNYETGFRRVPRDVALKLYEKVPGFDPVWLWTGEQERLGFDLRRRVREAEDAEKASEKARELRSAER